MKKGQFLLLIISWLFLGIIDSSAQLYDSQNYVIKNWGMEDGLPQSSVNNIIQTQDGYLWLATFGGLVRFDGHAFKTYNRTNTVGLRSDRIISLYEDEIGSLWVSTEDGFYKFENDQMVDFSIIRDGQVYPPLFIKNDGFNDLWVTVDSDPYRLVHNEFVKMQPIAISDNLESILNDERGIWMVLGKKVAKSYQGNVYLVYDFQDQIESKFFDIVEYPKESGSLFMATWNHGVFHVNGDEVQFYNENNGLPSGFIWQLYVDTNDILWVTASNGQSIWAGDHFEILNIPGLHDKFEPKKVAEDNKGNYWLGTVGNGLIRARPSLFQNIDADEGLTFNKMLSLHKTYDDQFLFGTNCDGVYEWNNERAFPSSINKFLENKCVWSVFKDSKGKYWFGSFGLYQSNSLDEPGQQIGEEKGFYGFDVYAIIEDSFGRIWIGSFNGVHVYENETFTMYNTDDGLAYNDTRVFFEDDDYTMWVGSSSGLSTISRNGTIKQIPLSKATNNGKLKQSEPYIRAIHKDSDGIYWIGTYGNGIFRIDGDSIVNITEEHGLFDNIVSHLIEDEKQLFWMSSNRGVFNVTKADLNKLANGKIDQVSTVSYGVSDGMNTSETNGGFQPSVIYHDQHIYFPTVDGVTVVNTRLVSSAAQSPEVYIEEVRTSDSLFVVADDLSLKHNDTFLQINYTAVELTDPEKISFKYKIEGYHDQWIEVGNQRQAIFTNIPPGSYTFKVTASDRNGMWEGAKTATFDISVIPPFWQATWFYVLIGFLFIAAGPISYYLRTQALLAENERQKRFSEELMNSQENERHRIASELHDSLGQQILVIKNRAELAKLSQQNQPELIEQLNEIVKSAQTSIDSVRSISHNLRPVHLEKFGITEAIESLCMEMQGSTNIEWTYELKNIDGTIPKDKEISFYRVIQEALNNILKHSEATAASIQISQLQKKVIVGIADNGIGFERDKIDDISNLGFLGMKERIQNFGGTFAISTFPGKGTLLTITIPIET